MLSEPYQHYFSFGSNMSIEQMRARRTTYGRILPAALPNYELVFNKISYTGLEAFANIEPDVNGNTVYGMLYMDCPSSTFNQLDGYEGVIGGHYARRHITVYVPESLLHEQTCLTSLPENSLWYNNPMKFDLQNPVEPLIGVETITYVAGEAYKIERSTVLPTTRYKNKILQGRGWLPEIYFKWLENIPAQEE